MCMYSRLPMFWCVCYSWQSMVSVRLSICRCTLRQWWQVVKTFEKRTTKKVRPVLPYVNRKCVCVYTCNETETEKSGWEQQKRDWKFRYTEQRVTGDQVTHACRYCKWDGGECVNESKPTPTVNGPKCQPIQLLSFYYWWNNEMFQFVCVCVFLLPSLCTFCKTAYAVHITAQHFLPLKSVSKYNIKHTLKGAFWQYKLSYLIVN